MADLGFTPRPRLQCQLLFPVLLALTLSLQQAILHTCPFSSGEILLNSWNPSQGFHMHYLLQASTHRSVRLTLRHATVSFLFGVLLLPISMRPFPVGHRREWKRAGDLPRPVVIPPTGSGFNWDPNLPRAFRKTTSSFVYNQGGKKKAKSVLFQIFQIHTVLLFLFTSKLSALISGDIFRPLSQTPMGYICHIDFCSTRCPK